MKLRRVLSSVLALTIMLCTFTATAVAEENSQVSSGVSTSVTYSGGDLGATYTAEKTTFKVWAPTASTVVLNRYATGSNEEAGAKSLGRESMSFDSTTGVWSCVVDGDIVNTYYTYSVTVDGVTKETQDVYSYAVGVNGERSMVVDREATNPKGWEDDQHVLAAEQTDAVIWELHVRDFSISQSSGVSDEYKGKYLAFTEGGTTLSGDTKDAYTCIDYLVSQGVKYVHLNPVYDFGSVDETRLDDDQYNWGYDPVNYNVPDGSYSTNPYDGNVRINEFKQMIQALHDRGIGVIMDVVYNHTYSIESCLQNTVPNYYYRTNSSGVFYNGSGCGNETKSEAPMYRKYMIDSVTYWAKEYHIDGFRFDLMGLHDYETMNSIRSALDNLYADGSGEKIIMYGEPWTGGPCGIAASNQCIKENASQISERIAFFNNTYRDGLKGSTEGTDGGYIQTGSASFENSVKAALCGNLGVSFNNGWSAKAPTQNILYQSAHDNLTLFDKLYASMDEVDSYTQYSETAEKLTMLAQALTLTGQGVPFGLAGEEFCRTKFGDNNSYNSLDEINQIDWTLTEKYSKSTAYYKGLLEIREAYSPFTDGSNVSANRMYFCHTSCPDGCLAFTIDNKTTDAKNQWKTVAVLANTTSSSKSIKLEGYDTMPTKWVIVANAEKAGVDSLGEISGNTVTVPAQSAMILVDKESFNQAAIQAREIVKITVKHVNDETDEVLKQSENLYHIGDTYRIAPDKDLSFYYDYVGTQDETTGTVTAIGKTITFRYKEADNFRGTVTINYLDENGEKVKNPKSIKTAEGEYYYYAPAKVQGYSLDTSKIPEKTAGYFGKENITLNFYYKAFENQSITVHYYNSNNWTRMYFYCYTKDGEEPMRAWPGTRIKTKDENGWHVATVEGVSEAQFCFNNGESAQDPAANMSGYTASGEVWIKDAKTTFNTTVIVSYVDTAGKILAEDTVKTLEKIDDNTRYSVYPKRFEGYETVVVPGNASGYCAPGIINVVYVYSKDKLIEADTDVIFDTEMDITQGSDSDISGANRLVGDINNDSEITMLDVTALQKYAAKLIELDSDSLKAADVNEDEAANMLDVVCIQRFIAKLVEEFPAGKYINADVKDSDLPIATDSEVTSDVTDTDTQQQTDSEPQADTVKIYFSNNQFWDSVYIYAWSSSSLEYASPWPGESMTFVQMNDYGEDIYFAEIDRSLYDMVVFSDGANNQTVNIDISDIEDSTGYYTTDKDGTSYNVMTYQFS